MRQPYWRKLYSYFRPVHLEQTSSLINTELDVVLSNGQYQLLTETAIYSYGILYDNFTKVFEHLPLDTMPIEEVLVLGLGLGSIPQMLEQKFRKRYYYTCIELDEEVIRLADKYVLSDLVSPMDVVGTDAMDFVFVTEQIFDMICVDVFVDSKTPSDFRHPAFISRITELLAPHGVVIYNCLGESQVDKNAAQDFYDAVFCPAFPRAELLPLATNVMLIGYGT